VKMCRKLLQMSLILTPLKEEDQTHRPVKQHNSNYNLNIRQLQDTIFVVCAHINMNIQLPNFSAKYVKTHCACMFHNLPYPGRFLNHGVITPWEKALQEMLAQYIMLLFQGSIIFILEKTSFTSTNNTTI